MTNWKVKKEKTTYKSELFEIKQTTFQNSQGKIKTHDDIYRRPGVFILPIADNGDLYLISEYRPNFKREIIDVCAGFIDKGEKPLDTAKRELQEEMGMKASHWEELARLELSASVLKCPQYYFIAKDLEIGEQKLEGTEQIKVIRLPIKEAVRKIYSGEIFIAPSIAGLLMLSGLKLNK